MTRVFIGTDPGKNGGLAVLNATGAILDLFKFTDATERDIHTYFADAKEWGRGEPVWAVIERVSASPQMGVTSAFTFGRGYGFLRGCLIGCGIPFDEVAPQTWQKLLGCRTGGDKNISKAKAQQLFPDAKVTHAVADALLLAEYARRTKIAG